MMIHCLHSVNCYGRWLEIASNFSWQKSSFLAKSVRILMGAFPFADLRVAGRHIFNEPFSNFRSVMVIQSVRQGIDCVF